MIPHQLAELTSGEVGTWVLAAGAVMGAALGFQKLFVRKPPIEVEFVMKTEFENFKKSVEKDMDSLRDKVDARFGDVANKLDEVQANLMADGQRRSKVIHTRIDELATLTARLDERTGRK